MANVLWADINARSSNADSKLSHFKHMQDDHNIMTNHMRVAMTFDLKLMAYVDRSLLWKIICCILVSIPQ